MYTIYSVYTIHSVHFMYNNMCIQYTVCMQIMLQPISSQVRNPSYIDLIDNFHTALFHCGLFLSVKNRMCVENTMFMRASIASGVCTMRTMLVT